jgi:DUF4097 and DUF4098 domain-containing protein YvlB
MKHRLISLGTCAVVALSMMSASGRALAASDRQHDSRATAAQPTLSEMFAAWPGAAPVDTQDYRQEVSDRQTHALAIGANGSLELKTVSGDITCVAGSGSTATVEVIRRSRGRTDADARLGLEEVRAVVDHRGERATVAAVYPSNRRQPPYSVDISYVVTAPAGTRVSAASVSGDVSVRDIKGDLSVASVSGAVTVSGAAQLSAAKSVSGDVSIVNAASTGSINAGSVSGAVRFDQVKAPQIGAESVSGGITVTRASVERASLKSVSGDIEFNGPIARGGRYEFQSHSGDVRVFAQGAAGFDLQLSTFSGTLRAAPIVNMRTGESRNTIRGTVGDGSAVLVATTFSGNVTVTR